MTATATATATDTDTDTDLEARHRSTWASGDHARMVETFLLPLGQRLVEACGIARSEEDLLAVGTRR